jgi:outer membrane protein
MIPVEPLANLQPDAVYATAIATLPQQKVNSLRIQSANKSVAAAKAGLYPTISAFAGMGTNSVNIKVPQTQPGPLRNTGALVNVNGTDYNVVAPGFIIVGEKAIPIGRQYNTNFSQNIGISLNVPIFNGRTARSNWDRSKLNLQSLQLDKELGETQLKQDIYKAYTDATAALQKFNANKRTAETAQKAYDFAKKRYEVGLLSIYDLVNSRNSFQTARIQVLYSQYDYVFKMKVLEFYKGQGIKL